mmetsp:Transcript_9933/g.15988  ORF Transcript_9933/g.15988 Transcript_9933/m.15988 type:complete len:80 (+) Transcript_9933:377-616(+)
MFIPDTPINDYGDDLARIADHSEICRRNKGTRHPGKITHCYPKKNGETDSEQCFDTWQFCENRCFLSYDGDKSKRSTGK